ncbi:MAG TPA: hypothetical protein VFX96_19085, partial [Pyrinomonadaceae bacterium]|nr:hypothetical protein [Pyrinomonadaceae bacterium]
MQKQHESQPASHASAARTVSAVVTSAALALSLSLATGAHVFAQPQSDRPKIAEEVDKKEGETAKPADSGTKPSGKRPKNNSPRQTPPPVEVTFTTDLPDTEIFLRRGAQTMQSLGKTDGGGRLVVRLPR